MTKPRVFISSSSQGLPIAQELQRQLADTALVSLWSDSLFQLDPSPITSVTEVADRSDFAVFLLTDDASARESRRQPRSNILFELGFLAGRLGASRTFILADPSKVALPSDLAGMMYIALPTSDISDVGAIVGPPAAAIRRVISEVQTNEERPTEFYSCFLSYASKDTDFVTRLHADLQEAGVRCWLDVRDLRMGVRVRDQIDKAIQLHDKVLLVLSEASAKSVWVNHEIEKALQLENKSKRTVLFPIRIDNTIFEASNIPAIHRLREKYIGDFTDWQNRGHYRQAFSRLVRDLAISASVESARYS